MLQTVKNIVGIIVGLLAAYGLITKTFDELSSLIPFFLSLMMLLWGIEEFQKKRKIYAWMLFSISIFSFHTDATPFNYCALLLGIAAVLDSGDIGFVTGNLSLILGDILFGIGDIFIDSLDLVIHLGHLIGVPVLDHLLGAAYVAPNEDSGEGCDAENDDEQRLYTRDLLQFSFQIRYGLHYGVLPS